LRTFQVSQASQASQLVTLDAVAGQLSQPCSSRVWRGTEERRGLEARLGEGGMPATARC
jgi:hypothetical protein